jgi:hypothetical protein
MKQNFPNAFAQNLFSIQKKDQFAKQKFVHS